MNEEKDAVRGRILLVEDEMVVAMLLEDMLDEIGFEVVATASREMEAVAAIEAHPIDAAILDVNLDGKRSYGIADALIARGIPFLFSTGYGEMALEPKYRQQKVLTKPFRMEELACALGSLLSGEPGE